MCEKQTKLSKTLTDKVMLLQDANKSVTTNITKQETIFSNSHISDAIENVQDLSSDLVQLVNVHYNSQFKIYKFFIVFSD